MYQVALIDQGAEHPVDGEYYYGGTLAVSICA
jgi:hypothetical protein